MLLSLLSGGSLVDILISLAVTIPIVMLALSLHETAHGYVAWKCGDSTAYHLGRLTLNPLKHLDLAGTLCMMLVGFGWAKPVPINARNFRNPKNGMALSAAAGPAANLLLGIISAVFYGFFYALYVFVSFKNGAAFWLNCIGLLWEISYISAIINMTFAFFNLIPVPPFDGSRIALVFLPPRTYFKIMKYEREIMYGILIAMLACSYIFDFSPFSWLANRLTNLIYVPVQNGFIEMFGHFV